MKIIIPSTYPEVQFILDHKDYKACFHENNGRVKYAELRLFFHLLVYEQVLTMIGHWVGLGRGGSENGLVCELQCCLDEIDRCFIDTLTRSAKPTLTNNRRILNHKITFCSICYHKLSRPFWWQPISKKQKKQYVFSHNKKWTLSQ